MNVRHLLILLTLPLINGCSTLSFFDKKPDVKPVEVITKPIDKTPLNLSEPTPFKAKEIKFIVITSENSEKVFAELKAKGDDMVLFGLTDTGYETLAITIAELRNLLAQQRSIIIKYKEYYEPKKQDSNITVNK